MVSGEHLNWYLPQGLSIIHHLIEEATKDTLTPALSLRERGPVV